MPYGIIKVDTVTFTDNGVDKNISLSGLVQNPTFTGNVTATGTISGDVIRGGTTISGVTVTGTTANFVSGVFTTQVSGATIIAPTGTFTSLTGTTTTGTTANFVSGVFSTQVSGATITGTTVASTTGTFTSLTGTTATFTSGIIASGTAALPSLAILSDPNTGIYSPGADQLAVATNGTERLRLSSTGEFMFKGAGTTPGTDKAVSFNGSAPVNSMVLDSSGRLGIGTSIPSGPLDVVTGSEGAIFRFSAASTNLQILPEAANGNVAIRMRANSGAAPNFQLRNDAGSNLVTITNGGLVGIGTTAPAQLLHLRGSGDTKLLLSSANNASDRGIYFATSTDSEVLGYIKQDYSTGQFQISSGTGSYASDLAFRTAGSERAKIDTNGRLLVGTSTARTNFNTGTEQSHIQLEGTTFNTTNLSIVRNSNDDGTAALTLGKSRSSTVNGNIVVLSGDPFGFINFEGADGTNMVRGASIAAQVDGTPGLNDMPGRLVFSTTADGASSPTTRMTIGSSGDVLINKTGVNDTTAGFRFSSTNYLSVVRTSGAPGYINRLTDDGVLLEFAQDNITEGSVSVSGTTVSYNGAHLSRWSQLPSGVERTEILRGTVLSNIDEMCEWGDEDNEQLNRMKVSDIEGDKNVSGVFQAWDDDDDTYTDDFYCAMTGDFIIRIAQDVTVKRGDLLMSAGDGTAKPQDDDIIRSKTIAKVTSTNVSCTYEDGSYCVPCVLMAC